MALWILVFFVLARFILKFKIGSIQLEILKLLIQMVNLNLALIGGVRVMPIRFILSVKVSMAIVSSTSVLTTKASFLIFILLGHPFVLVFLIFYVLWIFVLDVLKVLTISFTVTMSFASFPTFFINYFLRVLRFLFFFLL